jgi:adenine phosphoribosyltransferase
MTLQEELEKTIRVIPDFPKPGILFRDITPVLLNSVLTNYVTSSLAEHLFKNPVDAIAGIESRGFLFGMALAQQLGVGFIPIRKPGKLPAEVVSIEYDMEYGLSQLEVHADAIQSGMRIHIHDDLLATGGTAEASAKLITSLKAKVESFSFIVELEALSGRKKLRQFSEIITALVMY